MTRRTSRVAATVVAVLVAMVPVGPAAPIQAVDDACTTEDAGPCGNEHSKAVHAWVACKAEKGKKACVKPAPPGRALGHTKHTGKAPGPASADGKGHGWGRAHAPGQLKKASTGG